MSEQYRTLLSFMRDNEGGALFFYGIQERDKKNTTRTAVVDEIRRSHKLAFCFAFFGLDKRYRDVAPAMAAL
jgi:hypothetical protein